MEAVMTIETAPDILTINEVAEIFRCSKAHVSNALKGCIPGVPQLTHVPFGRRKLIRKGWLQEWIETTRVSRRVEV